VEIYRYIPHVLERLLLPRIRATTRSVLLLGPRQVGKSTLLAAMNPDLVLNLADPGEHRRFLARPEGLREQLAGAPASKRVVLIDEVQKVPALLDVLQVVLDATPTRFRFLLSGSSARKLKRGQANLLPGRVLVLAMHPLLERELAALFDLDRALAHGTLPATWMEPDADQRAALLRSYADVYLREEVQAEALVRDLGGYARLLDFVAAASGTVVNVNALCRAAEIGHETARRYLDVLEETLVMFRIPAWSGSARASLIAHPKLYLFDIGVRNALLRRPLDRPLDDERGVLLEHFVAQELHRRTGTLWPEAKLFHYRTKHGAEVDFVLELGRDVWGIEVKAARAASPDMLSGFASLAGRAKRLKRQILVCLGDRRSRIGDVEVIPLREFLAELPA
jgi:predicted AAA+ superfamily ATPase